MYWRRRKLLDVPMLIMRVIMMIGFHFWHLPSWRFRRKGSIDQILHRVSKSGFLATVSGLEETEIGTDEENGASQEGKGRGRSRDGFRRRRGMKERDKDAEAVADPDG